MYIHQELILTNVTLVKRRNQAIIHMIKLNKRNKYQGVIVIVIVIVIISIQKHFICQI